MKICIKAVETQKFGAPETLNKWIVLYTNAFHIVDIVWKTDLIDIIKNISRVSANFDAYQANFSILLNAGANNK